MLLMITEAYVQTFALGSHWSVLAVYYVAMMLAMVL
jgi:hypothetical protein